MGFNSENTFITAGGQVPWLVFDIETVPSPDCAQFLTEPIEAPSNYKDPEKIAAYIKNKRQQQIDEAGLDLDLCEVAAIAWEGDDNTGKVCLRGTMTEAHILRDFWQAVEGRIVIGFNVLHFDLLVLLRRSLYLGVPAPKIDVARFRHDTVIDLAELLSYGRRDLLRSLDFYCKRLGIPHDDTVTGADIARLVAEGDWKAVSRHVYDDVQATRAIAERLGVIRVGVAA